MSDPWDERLWDDDEREPAEGSDPWGERLWDDDSQGDPAPAPQQPQEEPSWFSGLLDPAASFLAGASLGGAASDPLVQRARPDIAEGSQRVQQEHPDARALGRAATGAAAQIAAGPSLLAQGAAGAALAGGEGYQRSPDARAAAVDAVGGAAQNMLGGVVARGLGAAAGTAAPAAAAGQGGGSWLAPLLKAGSALPGSLGRMARMGRTFLGGPSAPPVVPNETVRRAGVAGTQAIGELLTSPAGFTGSEKAYASAGTTDWVLKSVLSSGQSGLAPDQERELNEAVLSGDRKRTAAIDYQLRQRSPAYARAVEDAYKSLHGDDYQ